MEKVETVRQLRERLDGLRGGKIGFVPTMGALHEGHISLVEAAGRENDTVVASVFVNPTQFNDPDDLRNYPRTPEKDLDMLRAAGADLVFMPSVAEMYPEPDTRIFDFGHTDKVMEGATRPGHFNGVAQVVSRLFAMAEPDRAYFGQKDFQQVAVIRAMVGQLGLPVEIVECPIVREPDGLAMSSRNQLLTPEHRAAAPQIYSALSRVAGMKDDMTVDQVEEWVKAEVEKNPLLKVIYFQVVDAVTLAHAADWDGPRQGCIAVQAGNIRLIDNIRFL